MHLQTNVIICAVVEPDENNWSPVCSLKRQRGSNLYCLPGSDAQSKCFPLAFIPCIFPPKVSLGFTTIINQRQFFCAKALTYKVTLPFGKQHASFIKLICFSCQGRAFLSPRKFLRCLTWIWRERELCLWFLGRCEPGRTVVVTDVPAFWEQWLKMNIMGSLVKLICTLSVPEISAAASL